MARGSNRRPEAAERSDVGLELGGGLFGDPPDRLVQRQPGSRAARALILSSTSVMLRA